MKKILFVANIHKHFRAFHIPYIEYLKSEGYEVHVAANDPDTKVAEADKQFNLPINRNPFSRNNITAIKELKEIIEIEKYKLIHCHTAMGSVVARLAAKKNRSKGLLKVLYTAHGFHFYKGCPKAYWMLYYPMEKYLSKYTDGLITINEEDYNLAVKRKFQIKEIFRASGVGINLAKFKNLSLGLRDELRKTNGYTNKTFIIIYTAEFINRKDHKFILKTIPLLRKKIKNFKFIFAGRGVLKEKLENYARAQGLIENVDFLGFRKDIGELIIMSDVGVSVSKQEGLPMNIAEEMYAEKPVVVSKIRGHLDLVDHEKNGFLYERGNHEEFVNYIVKLYKDKELYVIMSKNAKLKSEKFELKNCMDEMKLIYKNFL